MTGQERDPQEHGLSPFNREEFWEKCEVLLYGQTPRENYRRRYEIAYQFTQNILGDGIKIDPELTPPEEIENITDEHVLGLEMDVSAMLHFFRVATQSIPCDEAESIILGTLNTPR